MATIDPLLLRTRVVDGRGLMTREWVRQQNQLTTAAANSTSNTETIADVQTETGADTPRRVYDDTELRALIECLVPPTGTLQDQIDELRSLLAQVVDAPAPLTNGVNAFISGATGTITIPKLTTANGSITVVNGIITAFTNPT